MGKAESDNLAEELEILNDKIQRGDLLIKNQRKSDKLSPTSFAPKVRGLRDKTFIAPPEESAKHEEQTINTKKELEVF